VKERPILFKGEMVRAILEGRKTQTRRVVKGNFEHQWESLKSYSCQWISIENSGAWGLRHKIKENPQADFQTVKCPYGKVGDRLWVRETFANDEDKAVCDINNNFWYRADGETKFKQAGFTPKTRGKWRPSIHMMRWASRITLEITDIRVERLNDISESDAIAEGIIGVCEDGLWNDPCDKYADLWESINGSGSWDLNPWVWVVEFKKI